MSTQGLQFEEIEPRNIPSQIRAYQSNVAIYLAAKKLSQLGPGRALKVSLNGVPKELVQKKAHVYFRGKKFRLRTRACEGSFYMWIEERQPASFEVTAIPAQFSLKPRTA